jgi:hypothetical protein
MATTKAREAEAQLTPEARRAIRKYVLSLVAVPTLLLAVSGYLLHSWIDAEVKLATEKAAQTPYLEAWKGALASVSALGERIGIARSDLNLASQRADQVSVQVDPRLKSAA